MRIWFNHWFSAAHHLIHMMRRSEDERFTIIGSSTNEDAVYREMCDEWYTEAKDCKAQEYIEFCLDFCRDKAIDVFVPRRFLMEISEALPRFEAQGVRVMAVRNAGYARMFENKAATYHFFKEQLPEIVPEYAVAHTSEEFTAAVEQLNRSGARVCYKLVTDEGARSFRVIDNEIENIRALYAKPGSKITMQAALKVLAEYDFSIPVLVMRYMPGVEISVDTLRTQQGALIIPRYKQSSRYSLIQYEDRILSICEKILDILDEDVPINIQFRLEEDRPMLLEINPRMSGGLQLSCCAAKVNLPGIALHQLIGEPMAWSKDQLCSGKVVHLETPVSLEWA